VLAWSAIIEAARIERIIVVARRCHRNEFIHGGAAPQFEFYDPILTALMSATWHLASERIILESAKRWPVPRAA
jgi:hypothetical protein